MRILIVPAAIAATLTAVAFGPTLVSAAPPVTTAAEPEHKHGHGEKHKLGRQTIGDYTVSVILIGEVEAGDHVDFDIKLIDAQSDPDALHVWIGTENGKGSERAKGTKGKTTYTGEVTAPTPLPEGARLWVQIETASGIKTRAFDFDRHGHKH